MTPAARWLESAEGQQWSRCRHTQVTQPLVAVKELYGDRVSGRVWPAVLLYALDLDGDLPWYIQEGLHRERMGR